MIYYTSIVPQNFISDMKSMEYNKGGREERRGGRGGGREGEREREGGGGEGEREKDTRITPV